MDKNAKIKPNSDHLNKSLDAIPTSLTEKFCPKYRKFANFNKQTNFESNQIASEQQTAHENQDKNVQENTENQQVAPAINLKLLQKVSQGVSMIDVNESTQIPALQQKMPSIRIQSLSKDSSLVESSVATPLPNLKFRKQFSKVRYRDGALTEDELKYQIKDHFNQLNSIIEKTSSHFEKRMKTHEDELLKIMMMEIKRVNDDCSKVINKYNELMKSKATSQQIDEARLETMYFRAQAVEMKKQNQELKKEIKYLKRLNNEYELKIKTDSDALKQMGIKLMSYKQKNKSIQRTLVEEVISKKAERLKELTSEKVKNSHLKLSPNDFSVLEGSKISCIQKLNSKSLEKTDPTQFRSGQKSLTSMRVRTEFISGASSNPTLTKSLVMKMNREINKKYKLEKTVQENCADPQTSKIERHSELTQNEEADLEANRQKILRFLKEARPSIKSIIQQKKTVEKKPLRKLTHEPIQKELEKLVVIKNRVRLSTFQQQRWQEFKNNSIDLTSVQHDLSQRIN